MKKSFTMDAIRKICIMDKGLFMKKKKSQNTRVNLKMAKSVVKVHFKMKAFIIKVNGLIICIMAKDH